jgi:predicted lipid carrier protein YhbT
MRTINPYRGIVIPSLKRVIASCPFTLQKTIANFLLRQAFCQAAADGDLEFLNDRLVALDVSDINYRATISLKDNQLSLVSTSPDHQVDVCIRGDMSAFTQLANRNYDPDSLFFQRRLCIEGDTDLGLQVKNLIDAVDLDELPPWLKKGLSLSQFIDKKLPSSKSVLN